MRARRCRTPTPTPRVGPARSSIHELFDCSSLSFRFTLAVFTRRKGGQNSSLHFQCNIFSKLFHREDLPTLKHRPFAQENHALPSKTISRATQPRRAAPRVNRGDSAGDFSESHRHNSNTALDPSTKLRIDPAGCLIRRGASLLRAKPHPGGGIRDPIRSLPIASAGRFPTLRSTRLKATARSMTSSSPCPLSPMRERRPSRS